MYESAMITRMFQPGDEKGIAALFRLVYRQHYVYPQAYLPSFVANKNTSGQWISACVEWNGRIVGHAALVKDGPRALTAELALIVVDPEAQGHGIATRLGAMLCSHAAQAHFSMLTIKQVVAHEKSQRLAASLGFQDTALMLSYVTSPFGGSARESVVLGCLPLVPRPFPLWALIDPALDRFKSVMQPFGYENEKKTRKYTASHPAMIVSNHGERIDVCVVKPSALQLDELGELPDDRLVYLEMDLVPGAPAAIGALEQHGYACAGFSPGSRSNWSALLLRGYQVDDMQLRCTHTRELFDRLVIKATESTVCKRQSGYVGVGRDRQPVAHI